jgi:hypothetical protein
MPRPGQKPVQGGLVLKRAVMTVPTGSTDAAAVESSNASGGRTPETRIS